MRTVCLIALLVTTVSLCALGGDTGQNGMVGTAAASLTNQHTFVIASKQPIRLSPGSLAPFDNTCYRIQAFKVRRIDNSDSTEPAGQTTCVYRNQVQMKNAAGSNSNE